MMPGVEARYKQCNEHGWVDQTGYEFELCADGHHWYQRCVCREQLIAYHTLGLKSMAVVILGALFAPEGV